MTNRQDLQNWLYDEILSLDEHEVLTEEKADQLAKDMVSFCYAAITKYIAGQAEHGGNIEDRNLNMEIDQELIDLFHYWQAKKRKEGR